MAPESEDIVAITASGSNAPLDPRLAEAWGQIDEDAQMDAIRTTQLPSQKSADTSVTDRRIAELEARLAEQRSLVDEWAAKAAEADAQRMRAEDELEAATLVRLAADDELDQARVCWRSEDAVAAEQASLERSLEVAGWAVCPPSKRRRIEVNIEQLKQRLDCNDPRWDSVADELERVHGLLDLDY